MSSIFEDVKMDEVHFLDLKIPIIVTFKKLSFETIYFEMKKSSAKLSKIQPELCKNIIQQNIQHKSIIFESKTFSNCLSCLTNTLYCELNVL